MRWTGWSYYVPLGRRTPRYTYGTRNMPDVYTDYSIYIPRTPPYGKFSHGLKSDKPYVVARVLYTSLDVTR